MSLRVLVVHESRITRKIAHDYATTEFSDALVDVAASAQDAAALLATERYDVVLCDLDTAVPDGRGLYEHARSTALNRDATFVVMSQSDDEALRNRLARRGIEHILPVPFTALQLRQVILEACDPRGSRVYPRYFIPGAKALLHLPEDRIVAEVLNISRNGLLGRFVHPRATLSLLAPCRIHLQFPVAYGPATTDAIAAQMLRLSVDSWREDQTPRDVRSAWRFVHVPEPVQASLRAALEIAQEDLLDVDFGARET